VVDGCTRSGTAGVGLGDGVMGRGRVGRWGRGAVGWVWGCGWGDVGWASVRSGGECVVLGCG
jgi:hypothetical protein